MIDESEVARHYAPSNLVDAIRDGLERLGKPEGAITPADLAPVDEFHIGGREASIHFHGLLGWHAGQRLLDIGCGIGGAARFVAADTGAHVTGVDLTPAYVEAGNRLSATVGLADRVTLVNASALHLPADDAAFDGAYMMHVGMNIADKPALFTEVRRVLRPGARFGIYDAMRNSDGEIPYPMPWASSAATCALSRVSVYREALERAGFTIEAQNDRTEYALAFFERLRAMMAGRSGPPPLGLHLLMGPSAPTKVANMIAAIGTGTLAPVEIVARAPGAT
ncbi:MAG: class I SAM-dependent methyltransferase [Burkholderiaceae bacterium]|nr:class I SAM-dependent methyltransferase [Burkholderiaceae bacterium]